MKLINLCTFFPSSNQFWEMKRNLRSFQWISLLCLLYCNDRGLHSCHWWCCCSVGLLHLLERLCQCYCLCCSWNLSTGYLVKITSKTLNDISNRAFWLVFENFIWRDLSIHHKIVCLILFMTKLCVPCLFELWSSFDLKNCHSLCHQIHTETISYLSFYFEL